MTNTKSTKRALLASVMAMLLCFSMLLGTTFAWFTDSAASGSNVITAGKYAGEEMREKAGFVDGTQSAVSQLTAPRANLARGG